MQRSIPSKNFFLLMDPLPQSFWIIDRFGFGAARAAAFAPCALRFHR
jgi:hypothetical protein